MTEDATWTFKNSAARPLGPVRNRSSALVLLPTLQPEISGTEATELCAVEPVEPPGAVVVLTGGEVVAGGGEVVAGGGEVVAGGDVVGVAVAGGEVVTGVVAGGEVVGVAVAGGEVVGGVVAGGDVVGGGVVVAGVVVLPGLGEAVVVVTLPPGAALGTVVGLG